MEERRSVLQEFCDENVVDGVIVKAEDTPKVAKVNDRVTSDSASESVVMMESVASIPEEERSLNPSTVIRFTTNLLNGLKLPQSDYFILKALHWFGTTPIPKDLIEILQSIVMSASKHHRPSKTPFLNLLSHKLLRVYPSTVIVGPANSQLPYSTTAASAGTSTLSTAASFITDSDFYYIPQLVIDSIKSEMRPIDRDFSLTTVFKSLSHYSRESSCDTTHATGLANVLSSNVDEKNVCFQEVYRLYLSLVSRTS